MISVESLLTDPFHALRLAIQQYDTTTRDLDNLLAVLDAIARPNEKTKANPLGQTMRATIDVSNSSIPLDIEIAESALKERSTQLQQNLSAIKRKIADAAYRSTQ